MLNVQQILKLFLANFHMIDSYEIKEQRISSIQKFLDEIDASQYNYFTSIKYREYFKEINTNISLLIDFFYHFGLMLRNFQRKEICLEYSSEIDKMITFINFLPVNESYNQELDFKKRKDILVKITPQIEAGNFELFWNFFYMFDVYSSIAKGIKVNNLVFPEFNADTTFTIKNFYHLDLNKAVKNTLDVKDKNTIVFTGANMSGKSTTMKSISTIVLLAHLGIAVPATYCNIPFYDRIFLYFFVNDNLKEGYSHFAQEIMNVKNVLLELQSKNCFAVFDEIFSGTNINDASQITVNTVNGLSKFKNSFFIFSTHLNLIENHLTENKNVLLLNLECLLENNKLLFTYKLKEGWSRLEIGKLLFDQYGLNELLNS
ncbi:MutS-related protein [Chryseobacterium sp. Mn2064]|uniref:MutS-related protein n=1 Tax=Chryseobacterium sp. Mn2064 TaxID=3395263 RepID=UPI003BCBB313